MEENKNKRSGLLKLILILLVVCLLVYLVIGFLSRRPVTDQEGSGGENTADTGTPDSRDYYSNYYTGYGNSYSGSWKLSSNVGKLNKSVASGVRAKRTKIVGNNKDVVTIMVYMCGSDLESQASMGVYDLQEMAAANISQNINLIVYTGGTTRWHTSDISTAYNQIYQVMGGGKIQRLVNNAGTGSMVDPKTLVSFIEFCADNFEADRYELIMWDHGGGSVSGYGYDEKYPKLGSMDLAEIDEALTEAGVVFDFIGFDACLMANTENALMLSQHADYLIASEESEPGIGWYYTDWLNTFSRNTSMPTIEVGQAIADSFVTMCQRKTPQQSATLSVVDLAEMQDLIPARLSAFARSTTNLLSGAQYRQVANARSSSREFAAQSYVDLVDLVDLANGVGTSEANELVKALLNCIKYNNTTRDMSNSYGLSIYFPYRSTKYVNSVLNTYNKMSMNSDYIDCVRNFVSYAASGQLSSGGQHNAYQSYNSYSANDYYSGQSSSDLIFSLIDMFLTGGYSDNSGYSGYYGNALDLLFGRDGIDRSVSDYIAENHFDADLTFKDGKIPLTKEQWSLIDSLKLNMFIDDGKGFIDLGKDNIYEISEDGSLVALDESTWLAASADGQKWQVVPYYFIRSVDDVNYGRIPVMINDAYADLLIVIDDEGIEVAGACYDYKDRSDVIAKNLYELDPEDEITFVCDYYDYDGNFIDAYKLGDPMKFGESFTLGDVDISSEKRLASYEIKDIYQQSYWTTPMN